MRQLYTILCFASLIMLNPVLYAATAATTAAAPTQQGVSGSTIMPLLPSGTGSFNSNTGGLVLSLIYDFAGQSLNTNSEDGGIRNTGGANINITGNGVTQAAFSNGMNYFTIPITATYYPVLYATTVNNNGGSGEWNTLQFVLFATYGGKTKTICVMNVNQSGGGGDNGGGYVYNNATNSVIDPVNCGPVTLEKGTQITATYQCTGSGTSETVLVTHGAAGVQTFPP